LNTNKNTNEYGLTKNELKKKLVVVTSQKLEINKNHSNQNSKFKSNEGIGIRMENTLVASSPSSTSPFSSFTNSSSSSSSSSSLDDTYANLKQKNQTNIQSQETESEQITKYTGFSIFNGSEKFHNQSMAFHSDKKMSKYFFILILKLKFHHFNLLKNK